MKRHNSQSLFVVTLTLILGCAAGCVPPKSVKKDSGAKKAAPAAKKSDDSKKSSETKKSDESKKMADSMPAKSESKAESKSKSPLQAEIKIGTDIQDHEAVGVANSFPADTLQVVAWTRITGAAEPTDISHVWMLNGAEQSTVTLSVKSSSFRTFSRKSVVGQKGKWKVVVKDAEGRVMGSKEFEVK